MTSSRVLSSRNAFAGHNEEEAGDTHIAPDVVPVCPSTVTVTVCPICGDAGVEAIAVTLFALAPMVFATAVKEKSQVAKTLAPVRSGRRSYTLIVCVWAAALNVLALVRKNAVADEAPASEAIC